MPVRLADYPRLPVGVNVSANGCLSLCVSSAKDNPPLASRYLEFGPSFLVTLI